MIFQSFFSLFLSSFKEFNGLIYPPPIRSVEFYSNLFNFSAKEIYFFNKPFPYIFIDNFFPEKILQNVLEEFPSYSSGNDRNNPLWVKSEINCQFRKLETLVTNLQPATSYLITQMQSSLFIKFLEKLTGIESLLPDPHLYGAGPHQTLSGGYLSIHLDYNYNENLKMWRRVNVFIYLNENWEEDWGGDLELWNENMTEKVVSLSPIFNRLVVFTASEISWHGHPEPLRCPPWESRKSIALYYYTVEDGWNRTKRQTDFKPRLNIDDWKVGEQYYRRVNTGED